MNTGSDETAKNITNNQPSVVYLGAAELSPNRSIGIKNRCPPWNVQIVDYPKKAWLFLR